MKALLQLALLCHVRNRIGPADAALREAAEVVERAWRRPEFPGLIALDPRYARQFQLMYAALAPDRNAEEARRAARARLAADGCLAPGGTSAYLQLETRYYADLADIPHRLTSRQELYERSVLAQSAAQPAAEPDVCEATHTVFYLSDFGFRDSGLTGEAREQAVRVVDRLTDRCVRHGAWDFIAKLLLAQYCLGVDPLSTPSGVAGVRALAGAMSPGGAIPGRSAAERASATATPVAFFRQSYQATLGAALAMLIITSGRAQGLSTAGTSTVRGAL